MSLLEDDLQETDDCKDKDTNKGKRHCFIIWVTLRVCVQGTQLIYVTILCPFSFAYNE